MDHYTVDGMSVTAVLRSMARRAKSDAYLGTRWDRALTPREKTALNKVARLLTEARRALETA